MAHATSPFRVPRKEHGPGRRGAPQSTRDRQIGGRRSGSRGAEQLSYRAASLRAGADPPVRWSRCWAPAFQITKTSHLLRGYNHAILMNTLTDSTMDEKSEDSRIF